MILYNLVIYIAGLALRIIGLIKGKNDDSKLCRFIRGQQGLIKKISREYRKSADTQTAWIHASSLGEYAVAKPLISQLKARGIQVVMTFFSPSGYEVLNRDRQQIDYVFYLPLDTPRNARRFIETIKPDYAIFIISEYWLNYLRRLRIDRIPTYLVSAKINADSQFFKWYGGAYRRCLKTYRRFFVLNEETKQNLARLGFDNVTVSGNPLFDNAIEKSQTPWTNEIIARFCGDSKVFIAGSIHDSADLTLVSALANRNPDQKFIFVPHAISRRENKEIAGSVKGKVVFYSECDASTDLNDCQVLVIDFVGALAYIYRYGTWAYIGGGFTKLLHSLIEATVYGLPVSFGPNIGRKVTPEQLIKLGIGHIVTTPDEICRWFDGLKSSPEKLAKIRQVALDYVKSNAEATPTIIKSILNDK